MQNAYEGAMELLTLEEQKKENKKEIKERRKSKKRIKKA
jgi:hypothetical protein